MAFILHFPCGYITSRGYLFEGLQETRGYSLKEQAVFLKRQSLTFSIAAGSIIHLFHFKFAVTFRGREEGVWGL